MLRPALHRNATPQDPVVGTCGRSLWEEPVGAASRGDYAQDVRYIARSTWMCGAIGKVVHDVE